MKNTFENILKAGLALITGWVGAAVLLLSLAFVTQTAFAGESLILECTPDVKYTANLENRHLEDSGRVGLAYGTCK